MKIGRYSGGVPNEALFAAYRESGIEVMELGVDEAKEDVPCFATIQGYKGLDAKIVILCDVDDIHDKNYSRFIYIAATRARTLLYIVGSEEFWQHHT